MALRDMHPDLTAGHEDWEVLRELKIRGGVAGLITLDAGMLSLPREMVVLHQSRLTLVVVADVDNDPIVAAGLLMVHLPAIVRQHSPSVPQLWMVRRPPAKHPENPWQRLRLLAERSGQTPEQLYDAHKLPSRTFLRRSR